MDRSANGEMRHFLRCQYNDMGKFPDIDLKVDKGAW